MKINHYIFIKYYIVINIATISFLIIRCVGTKQSSSDSSIDEEKPTKRTRTTTVSTTQDPRFEVVPKVMVFDLDYVIWPYNVAVDIKPPFALNRYVPSTTIKPKRGQKIDPLLGYDRNREVIDHNGKLIKIYDGVEVLLGQLKRAGTKIAVISQTPEIATVHHLLKMLDINRFIDYVEVSMESNTVHIQRVSNKTGAEFRDMIFFGWDRRFMRPYMHTELICIPVPRNVGLTREIIYKGLCIYVTWPYEPRNATTTVRTGTTEEPDIQLLTDSFY